MKTKTFFIIITPIICFSLFYGILIGTYEFFPYNQLSQIKQIVTDENISKTTSTISSLDKIGQVPIQINNESDIFQKQNLLINYIWKNELPKDLPLQVEKNFNDKNFYEFENIKRLEKISIEMEHDVQSIVYHMISDKPNNKLILYHHGHSGDFLFEKKTINYFLEKGYSILAFNMPLKGMNNQPVVDIDNLGKIKLTSHRHFTLLESDDFSPLKYFLHPITISLNYIDQNYDYSSYHMIGISGGGWTTILYSAIDERISQSFSVAGSYPIYLRLESKDIGDYEQIHPQLYQIANYLELYVMGSFGENRKLVQIFNKYDPCCFTGELSKQYEALVKTKISELDGEFDIHIDDSHKEHKISTKSLQIIHNSIEEYQN
jgi:hypothetical protein